MKKKIVLLVSLLFILVLFVGCLEDVVPPVVEEPPVVVPKKFTVEVVQKTTDGGKISPVGTSQVQEGKDFTLSITKELGYKNTLIINGSTILADNAYTFKVYDNYKIEFSSEKTDEWYLIQKPWKTYSWQRRLVTSQNWTETLYPPKIDVFTLVFKDNRAKEYDSAGILKSDTPYNIIYGSDGKIDSLTIGANSQNQGGLRMKVIKLDTDSLQLRYRSKFYDAPYVPNPSKDMMIQENYVH